MDLNWSQNGEGLLAVRGEKSPHYLLRQIPGEQTGVAVFLYHLDLFKDGCRETHGVNRIHNA